MRYIATVILIVFFCSSTEADDLYQNCVSVGVENQMKGWDESDRHSVTMGVQRGCVMVVAECESNPGGETCKAFKAKFNNVSLKDRESNVPSSKVDDTKNEFDKSQFYGEWEELGRGFEPTSDYSKLMRISNKKHKYYPEGKFEFIRLEDGQISEIQVGLWDFENGILTVWWPKSGYFKSKVIVFDDNVLGIQDIDSGLIVYLKKIMDQ